MPHDTRLSRRQFSLGVSALLAASLAKPSASTAARPQTPVPQSEKVPMDAFDQLARWLTDESNDLGVPGAAVGVVTGNQRFTQGIGVANADTGDAFTPSTLFGIASLTKVFTANALALLAQDGAVRLDGPIRQYLPDFRLDDSEATDAVTTGHLLSHAGGWADVLEPEPGQDSLDWYAANMAHLPQIVPAGTRFSYSNSGFMLAGAILEHLTGVPYEDTISDSILQPLGMQQTGFTPSSDPTGNQATGHQVVDGELVVNPPADIPRAANPAAGLYSTVEDLLAFVEAHASIDPGQLNADAVASMHEARNTGGSVGPIVVDHIGTGWMLLDIDGESVLMSQGGDAGLMSAMVAVPARRFGMVVLANSESAMMLVNDAVLHGLTTFTGLSLPETVEHTLTANEIADAEGQFGFPEWMTFTMRSANGSLHLETAADGEEIPDLSGPVTLTSPTQGFVPHLGGKAWLDFVPDGTGSIQWLRFAGRLVPRSE